MARRIDWVKMGHAAAIVVHAIFRFVGRTVSGLAVWILPIMVLALTTTALTDRLSFHPGGGPAPDPEHAQVNGEQPLAVVNLYYSREYIRVVRQAHERGHDILAGFKALEAAWKTTVPSRPLVIELINSSQPQRLTGQDPAPTLRAKVAIDEKNFADLCPFLEDVRTIILEGDGSGCGRLSRSAYWAQPASESET
jgi:hypothetical protein